MAVLGFQPGQNLFVAPDGRWQGGYTPAACRAHPFALASLPGGEQVLAFDAGSGLLAETGGEPFYDADGQPAQAVRDILAFLTQLQADRERTRHICQALMQMIGQKGLDGHSSASISSSSSSGSARFLRFFFADGGGST